MPPGVRFDGGDLAVAVEAGGFDGLVKIGVWDTVQEIKVGERRAFAT